MISAHPIVLVAGAVLIALSCGTIYAFSAYAPQLASHFSLSSYQLNLLGGAANCGAYLTGPLVGSFVDARGPRPSLLAGAACLASGYLVLCGLYRQPERIASTFGYSNWKTSVLMACQFSVGMGSSLSCVAASNAVAKGIAPHSRANALACTFAGVGLSAFLYSTAAHTFFSGKDATSSLLGLLGVGCGVSVLVGQQMIHSSSPFLSSPKYSQFEQLDTEDDGGEDSHSSALGEARDRSFGEGEEGGGDDSKGKAATVDVHGRRLWQHVDFLLLFSYALVLLGTGLLFINNAGLQVATLYISSSPEDVPPVTISGKQAFIVTVISLSNCAGRLIVGSAAEKAQKSYGLHRPVWLILAASAFLLGSLSAGVATVPDDLVLPSLLFGVAYGSFFGLAPVLVADFFGLPHFSTNFGFLTMAPSISGPMLSSLFGMIYDSHVPPDAAERHLCPYGHECYSTAFSLTSVLSLCAVALATLLTYRRGLWTTSSAASRRLDSCAH